MSRPTPTISSRNEYETYFYVAQEFAERFATCGGVMGVLLTGGVARGHADHFSELDLAIYLTRQEFEEWTCQVGAPFPEGDAYLEGWHVDFEYLCYEDERDSEWDHLRRWDRSYAVILYDPQGMMAEMLARKVVLTAGEKERLTSRHLVLYGDYFCLFVVPSWLHRQDLVAAHHCLNVALHSLIKAVFVANDELIPFDKWSLNLSWTLPWTPINWQERVEQALVVREISRVDVERRLSLILGLLAECRARLLAEKDERLGAIETRKLQMLRLIRERGALRAAEFERRFGLRETIRSPLFHFIHREMRQAEAWLVFDEDRFKGSAAQEFEGFLEWDQALLSALARDTDQRDAK